MFPTPLIFDSGYAILCVVSTKKKKKDKEDMNTSTTLLQIAKLASFGLVTTPMVMLFGLFVDDVCKFFHYVVIYGLICAIVMFVATVAAHIVDEL